MMWSFLSTVWGTIWGTYCLLSFIITDIYTSVTPFFWFMVLCTALFFWKYG